MASPQDLHIVSVLLNASALTLTWQAQAGQTYRIQSKDELDTAAWKDLIDVTATGSTASTTRSTDGAPHRFYRIQWLTAP